MDFKVRFVSIGCEQNEENYKFVADAVLCIIKQEIASGPWATCTPFICTQRVNGVLHDFARLLQSVSHGRASSD